jgi:hypothetical protein
VPRGSGGKLDRRVVRAAEAALAQRRFVTAIDVLVGLGWLEPRRVDEWRQGRVPYLEAVVIASLGKISTAMNVFRHWAAARLGAERDRVCGAHEGSAAAAVLEVGR